MTDETDFDILTIDKIRKALVIRLVNVPKNG
nr:MAG TPA: hypothetical protein [Caudoviricetes sp.]